MSGQQQGGGESVWINDVVMRDGLQMEPVFVPTSEKVALIDEIGHCGLNRIEATSFTSAKAIPALSGAEAVMHEIERVPGVRYAALVLNRRGAERALECGVDELNLGVSASETHNLANTRMTRAQAVRALLDITAFCRDRLAIGVSIATAFGCPMEGAIDIDSVLDIGNQFVAAGVRGITLCDTTGMANPRQVKAVCGALAARWRGIELTCICITRAAWASQTSLRGSMQASAISMRHSAALAAVPSRQARAAISAPKISSICSTRWDTQPASIWSVSSPALGACPTSLVTAYRGRCSTRVHGTTAFRRPRIWRRRVNARSRASCRVTLIVRCAP
ncbi:hypothetical protein HDG35_007017 [Paraburkholderia sp. JPY681]|nr:hypothetical protein [Paraburkholderia atlantica]